MGCFAITVPAILILMVSGSLLSRLGLTTILHYLDRSKLRRISVGVVSLVSAVLFHCAQRLSLCATLSRDSHGLVHRHALACGFRHHSFVAPIPQSTRPRRYMAPSRRDRRLVCCSGDIFVGTAFARENASPSCDRTNCPSRPRTNCFRSHQQHLTDRFASIRGNAAARMGIVYDSKTRDSQGRVQTSQPLRHHNRLTPSGPTPRHRGKRPAASRARAPQQGSPSHFAAPSRQAAGPFTPWHRS